MRGQGSHREISAHSVRCLRLSEPCARFKNMVMAARLRLAMSMVSTADVRTSARRTTVNATLYVLYKFGVFMVNLFYKSIGFRLF